MIIALSTTQRLLGMTTTETIISFIFYSVVGWGIDTLTRSIIAGKWVSENVLGIPFSPIYGLGALLILWLFTYIKEWKMRNQFLLYATLLAVYEYSNGRIIEWLFGRRLWDYSHLPFSTSAYTDPVHAIVWGVLGLVTVYVIQPWIHRMIIKLKKNWFAELT